jgi:hypothetical protein
VTIKCVQQLVPHNLCVSVHKNDVYMGPIRGAVPALILLYFGL